MLPPKRAHDVQSRIAAVTSAKDQLEPRVILPEKALQVFFQMRFHPAQRLQKAHGRQGRITIARRGSFRRRKPKAQSGNQRQEQIRCRREESRQRDEEQSSSDHRIVSKKRAAFSLPKNPKTGCYA